MRTLAVLRTLKWSFWIAAVLVFLSSVSGCAALRDKVPELLKVVCPRCAAVFELLKGTDHTHELPSADGADND